jgi:tRNA threonylcarbamoyladenosine modification (KEOPS) complex  Pcc1 subunit
MKNVSISFELDKSTRKIVCLSLLPELGRTVPRTDVAVSENDSGVTLSIDAEDSSALRAALNSYLRWINSIISTVNTFSDDP